MALQALNASSHQAWSPGDARTWQDVPAYSNMDEAVHDPITWRRRTLSSTNSEGSVPMPDLVPKPYMPAVSTSSHGQRSPGDESLITGSTTIETSLQTDESGNPIVVHKRIYQCWEHGCEGRVFSTLSNYRRHCRERSMLAEGSITCPLCGKRFTRASARNAHLEREIRSNASTEEWTALALRF